MIIKKPFIFIVIPLLICGLTLFSAQSSSQPVTNAEVADVAVSLFDGKTEIAIKGTAPFTYSIHKQTDPYQVVIDLQDTGLGKFTDNIVVDSAGVLEIRPVKDENLPNIARFKISLTVPADIEPTYRDNSLILAFDNPDVQKTATVEEVAVHVGEEEIIPDTEEIPEAPFAQKEYVGEKISIDFQDVALNHVFRLISDISKYNIVVSPDVKGRFSMKLIDVPWDQALDIILRNYGLSKIMEGNVIRVAPTAVLAQEEEAIARAKESREKAGDLVTRVYPINYADVKQIKKAIDDAKILTSRGFVSVDERTTSVIIKDVDKKQGEYENLISALDVPAPQVSINARIVEVGTNFTRELGIQWGANIQPSPQTQISGTNLSGDNGFFSGNPLSVNLPAAVGAGSGGTVGIGYISASALRSLDLQLSAAESTGKGKVISNPRVITMDNQKAVIRQGKKIPYETISDQGTKTEFVDAALELVVTPHITPEGTILMNVEVAKNEADFSNTSNNVPTIDTNEIETQVLINDGDTLALGGIFKTNVTKDISSVPGLGQVPILGWVFKNELKKDDVTETLVFITPRIIK